MSNQHDIDHQAHSHHDSTPEATPGAEHVAAHSTAVPSTGQPALIKDQAGNESGSADTIAASPHHHHPMNHAGASIGPPENSFHQALQPDSTTLTQTGSAGEHPGGHSQPAPLPADSGDSDSPTPTMPVAHSGHGNDSHTGPGHDAHTAAQHAHHDPNIFKQKFWISVLLTIPVLAFSEHFLGLLGLAAPHFPGSHYIPALFGILVFIVGGMVFLQGGINELRQRQPGMMTLIALAIMVSFGYSLLVTLGFPGQEIFWELATLIDIMLLGHWLEMRAVQNAGSALDEMAKLLPDTALKIEGDQILEVTVGSLVRGDLLLIRPGARIPADGQVVQGDSQVNQAMVTGESMPVTKQVDDQVIAGTINGEGSLRIKVTRTGDATYLAGIMRLVDQAQRSRSRSQILADRAAFWLVIIAIAAAIITAVAWTLSGARSEIIMERVVTVMVAACPHALGLAIPLVIAISTSLCAQAGLLVRNRLMFEEARDINYVVFDKTGTLTQGRHQLIEIVPAASMTADQVLRLAAAAEYEAEHVLAKAIVNNAQERGLQLPPASNFESRPGRGVTAEVEGHQVQVGGPNLLALLDISLPPELAAADQAAAEAGYTIVYLLVDGAALGLLTLADKVKEESKEAIENIQAMGMKVAMLTGDNQKVAAQTARQLDISEYFAGVLPENKAAVIKELQGQGYRVAMVGDGVNDAPALVQADVGIAIGAGTDVAVESAGIVLVRNDPRDVAQLFTISRATYRKMVQNLGWATAYNIVVIPLAAGVLAPWGFVLPMAAGAVVMSLSTIIVAVNAQLLRQVRPAGGK